MAAKNTAVFGIYPSRLEMEEAVDRLHRAGFRGTDISALLQENQGTKDFAHEKNTKAPEGLSAGAIAGAIVGGVLGWLIGIGALTVPHSASLVAAGPIVAALAGIGALGVLGGIIGALVGMGIPEYEARRFEGRIRHGGVLVSVHCDNQDWVKRAKDVMEHAGGQKIGSESEKSGDFANADKPLPRARATTVVAPPPDDEVYVERSATRPRTSTDLDDDVK
jgi:F0F1-type ATP synthase assembly protein I